MAFGTIISEYGNGKYRVTLEVDTALSENLKNRLTAKKQAREDDVATYETELADLLVEEQVLIGQTAQNISDAEAAIAVYEGELNLLAVYLGTLNEELSAIKQDPDHTESELNDKQAEVDAQKKAMASKQKEIDEKKKVIDAEEKKLTDKRQEILDKQDEINFTDLEIQSLEKEIARVLLYGYPTITSPQDVWCVDLTENLGGKVALLEVATDTEENLNIFPGYSGQVAPTLVDHGNIEPFYSLGTADSLRNFLIYPAIQKWKPSFRYGLLGPVNYEANTATVYLSYINSRIQSLSINQANTLYNVPVEYMQCKAGAFEEGDAVVVQFTDHDWSTPKVIGFQRAPKPCGWEEPWDGPLYTSRYPWNYRQGNVECNVTIPPATIEVIGGELFFHYDATPEDSYCWTSFHNMDLINTSNGLTDNVTRMKVDADGRMKCADVDFVAIKRSHVIMIGLGEDEQTLVGHTMTLYDDRYYSGIGCTDYPGYAEAGNDTGWSDASEGSEEFWWWPEGGVRNYRLYSKQHSHNEDVFVNLVEPVSRVFAVAIETQVNDFGGLIGNTKERLEGLELSINMIALA